MRDIQKGHKGRKRKILDSLSYKYHKSRTPLISDMVDNLIDDICPVVGFTNMRYIGQAIVASVTLPV